MAALIAAQRDQRRIPHAVACRALGVSRSWFYKHKDGELPPRAARRAALAAEVRRLFAARRGTYGSPWITADLREAGWKEWHRPEASSGIRTAPTARLL